MSTSKQLRWGIISTAVIAKKFVAAVRLSKTATVVSVGSRDLEKAQIFAQALGIPKAVGSYLEIIDDPDVDAVYIPVPTTMKSEWAVKAAEKGKHILVEKPFMNEEDLQKIITAARQHNVVFMDGTMWVHGLRTKMVCHGCTHLATACLTTTDEGRTAQQRARAREAHQLGVLFQHGCAWRYPPQPGS